MPSQAFRTRMHTPRFHCPLPVSAGVPLNLPAPTAHHAVRVLRLQTGTAVVLFDGSGAEYLAELTVTGKDSASVLPGPARFPAVESPLPVWLGQGLSQADKFDLVLQKSVELGVSALTPLALQRSLVRLDAERGAKRLAHWQGVVVAACEQSGRVRVPRVDGQHTLAQWIAGLPVGALRLRLAPEATLDVAALELPAQGVVLAVGPEGGFDPAEVAQLDAAGFIGVRLGPRILRTETAALAALAALQAWHGDFRATGPIIAE